MRDRTTDGESKIPILGDLPIIGWLFKQRSSNVEKVNLLLVLTPYIIHDSSDFQRIFERKLNEYEEFAAEYYGHKREYRAHIDYERKSGPLARLATTITKERAKLENGGGGDGAQTLIKPDPLPEEKGIPVPGDAENHPEDLEEGTGSPEDPEPGLEVPDGDDAGMRATDDVEMPESPAVEPHPDMPPPGEEE
jgi:general secretion pathway protein D